MLKIPYILLTLLIVSGTVAQSCGQPNPATDFIDSGKVSLTRKTGSRQHCFSVPINFNLPNSGSVDVAISSGKINGYNAVNGFDFLISGGRQGQFNTIGFNIFIDENNRWSSIDVSYIVSARNDLILGSFIGNMYSASSCAMNSAVSPSTVLQNYLGSNKVNKNSNYKVAAFISGLRTLDPNYNIRIQSSDLNITDSKLIIQIQSKSTSAIQLIQISYIIYTLFNSNSNNDIIYNYGVQTQSQSTYKIQGIVSLLQTKAIQVNQFSVCKRVQQCPNSQVYSSKTNKCECVQNYVRVSGLCLQSCGNNAYIGLGNICVCMPGYNRDRNYQCVNTTNNNNNNNNNQCGDNEQFAQNGGCICKVGFSRAANGKCMTICGDSNQVWNGNACVCVDGFAKNNKGQCVFISMGMPNMSSNCPTNQVRFGNGCQCALGYSRNSRGQCMPVSCADLAFYDNASGKCVCYQGYKWNSDGTACIAGTICPSNSHYDVQKGCVCDNNFGWNPQGNACVWKQPISCPPNSLYNNNPSPYNNPNNCICINNYAWNSDKTQCVLPPPLCPLNASPDNNNKCNCNSGYQWTSDRTQCVQIRPSLCPPNSIVNSLGVCQCNGGLQLTPDGRQCVPISVIVPLNCGSYSIPNADGSQCVCINGYYMDSKVCKKMPTCPANSTWSQDKLQCICNIGNQYIINNICQACPANQVWNVTECICKNNLYRINGVCRVCDTASTYNGSDCLCNNGYYGNRDKCDKCDASCGKCTGPAANQCLTCADITYLFAKGYCSKGTCPPGFYITDNKDCAKCSDYCQSCTSELACDKCAPGFTVQQLTSGNDVYSSCASVCGDGLKNDLEQCDDNNTKSGDGCSSDCTIEKGWSCQGGTSVQKSTCSKQAPARSVITVKGAVNLIGKVIQSVRLSYIPTCFTDNNCVDCYKILDVKVIEGNLPTNIKVIYVPNNDGQFTVQYQYGSYITSTVFKYQIQINKNLPSQYSACFNDADYGQQIVNTVDTALLAQNDNNGQLSLDDITAPATIASAGANSTNSTN